MDTANVSRALSHRRSSCLDENAIARAVEGLAEKDELERLERHIDQCPSCFELLGVANTTLSRPRSRPLSRRVPRSHGDELPAGAKVSRYVLRGVVGAGSMGRVYLAYDPVLERRVALKLLHADDADSMLEARLLREAKVMARLPHHPDVLTVYDAGTCDKRVFIAMELVDGGTARAWLRDRHSWQETVSLFLRAGRGLAHAHACGLIHRDFKPDNVLVGRDGRVHVSDFGLASSTQDDEDEAARSDVEASSLAWTQSGMLIGTPAYMAPEQLNGGHADVRSDIFSFCVAFYEALYGERPFAGRTVAELRVATCAERRRPAPAREIVPRGITKVLIEGLRAEPKDRPATMNELLEAIAREARRAERRPRKAALMSTAIVLLAVASVALPRGRAPAPLVEAAPTGRAHRESAPPYLRPVPSVVGRNGAPILR